MATGVKPRDDDVQFTRTDLEAIQDAMKSKKFRDMLAEYCEEVRDPANQALYQKEMTQLEKERGYDVTFINPKGGYVIKTSVAGDRKAFINICSNDKIGKPSCAVQKSEGRKGLNWQIPYSLIPPREDYDNNKKRCVVYDVVFHPDTLRMADQNKQFRDLVNKTAFDALKSNYDIHLDSNNLKFPRSSYKGMVTPAVIRKEDPNFKPHVEEDNGLSPDLLDKLYPQRSYTETQKDVKALEQPHRKRAKNSEKQFAHAAQNGYTIPKFVIKQQKNVDFQDYTFHKDSKQYFAIPTQIVVEVDLPLLSSTMDCTLDVQQKTLSLISEKPAKYKLNVNLPYNVDDQAGNAKFDKSKRKLIVSLPVIKPISNSDSSSFKADSGVESEENSQSDEDYSGENLIEELPNSDKAIDNKDVAEETLKPEEKSESFLDTSVGYALPPHTHNALDDTVAFTFHVKNTEPDSVKVMNVNNKVFIKFISIGAGFVPVHYAAIIVFEENVTFEHVSGEAWDNNVILQLEVAGELPHVYQIGLTEDSLNSETIGVPLSTAKVDEVQTEEIEDEPEPIIEVVNHGNETNIVVSSNGNGDDYHDEDDNSDEKDIVWVESNVNRSNAKSILRKPRARSLSESSVGDIASSMDYISSDCIPEESSFKKTVRFSDVIGKQFYRYNSSIEGQKRKNQRKKSKKRSQDRRRSESEAEEDSCNDVKFSKPAAGKPTPKAAVKQRRDSGLADTDAENNKSPSLVSSLEDHTKPRPESVLNIVDNNIARKQEPAIWESKNPKTEKHPPTSDNIKHNTDLYNPDKLNKGEYLEVKFKNDLIFDLDM